MDTNTGGGKFIKFDRPRLEEHITEGVALLGINAVSEMVTSAIRRDRNESILIEAARIRGGERNADYGDAVENFRRITEIANAITGLELTPAQCCKVMIAVKLARELHNHKRDNLVDMCGYADILELIETSKPVGDEK